MLFIIIFLTRNKEIKRQKRLPHQNLLIIMQFSIKLLAITENIIVNLPNLLFHFSGGSTGGDFQFCLLCFCRNKFEILSQSLSHCARFCEDERNEHCSFHSHFSISHEKENIPHSSQQRSSVRQNPETNFHF